MGVQKVGKKWRARGYIMGKQIHLGMFKTKHEAEHAISEANDMYKHVVMGWGAEFHEDNKHNKVTIWQRMKLWFKK